jgi:hypothetical protein
LLMFERKEQPPLGRHRFWAGGSLKDLLRVRFRVRHKVCFSSSVLQRASKESHRAFFVRFEAAASASSAFRADRQKPSSRGQFRLGCHAQELEVQ